MASDRIKIEQLASAIMDGLKEYADLATDGKERIQEMIEYLKSQPKRVTAYDEQLVRKLIEKITVYDDHLDFLFRSGIQIEIKG